MAFKSVIGMHKTLSLVSSIQYSNVPTSKSTNQPNKIKFKEKKEVYKPSPVISI